MDKNIRGKRDIIYISKNKFFMDQSCKEELLQEFDKLEKDLYELNREIDRLCELRDELKYDRELYSNIIKNK